MPTQKRKPLEAWQVDDAQRLRHLFRERTKLTQEAFAQEFGFGTQGAVWQYLHARIPLNLLAALRFARGLDVPLAAISPTLAAQVAGIDDALEGVQMELTAQLRYLLHATFPELTDADIAEVVGYARGKASVRKSGDDKAA
jgi:transcriptional regulator with XRE-family HTH domain